MKIKYLFIVLFFSIFAKSQNLDFENKNYILIEEDYQFDTNHRKIKINIEDKYYLILYPVKIKNKKKCKTKISNDYILGIKELYKLDEKNIELYLKSIKNKRLFLIMNFNDKKYILQEYNYIFDQISYE